MILVRVVSSISEKFSSKSADYRLAKLQLQEEEFSALFCRGSLGFSTKPEENAAQLIHIRIYYHIELREFDESLEMMRVSLLSAIPHCH